MDAQLSKAITITDQSFSLENDMLFGWQPKIEYGKQLQLNFNTTLNDQVIQSPYGKLLYLGFRPQDTGQMHKQYSNNNSYTFAKVKVLQRKPQIPFLNMNPDIESRIQFNSTFESGNLDIVIQTNHNEYDLYMRVDGNTKRHTSWYYFEINGMYKNESIQLNICNFRKQRILYERGMRPYICYKDEQWQQGGENVQFKNNQNYSCLSFTLNCKYDKEPIKIAYCVPYTYTQLLEYSAKLERQCEYVERSVFCESLSGVQLPLFTFSKNRSRDIKCLVIQARIHPGESNGSYVMQGLLEYLSTQHNILDKCVIKVVPMMNPDGVIMGNYRTGVAGKDLNRRFKLTDQMIFTEVWAMKKMIKELYSIFGNNLIGFIDLHGHSVKKNVFLYGPEFSLWNYNYYKSRLLAKLLNQKTDMFRFYSSIFRISQQKRSTARGVFFDLYDIVNCFTIETSNGCYYDKAQTYEFTTQHWLKMGWLIGEALNDMIDMQIEMDSLYDETKTRRNIVNKKRSFTTHGDDQCYLKFQNTKFAKIFEEIREDANKMDCSFSEGQSDSSSDESETNIEDIKQQLIEDRQPITSIQQIQNRKSFTKSIIQSSQQQQQQQPLSQQSFLLSQQKSEKKLNLPPRSAQTSIIKKTPTTTKQQFSKITNYVQQSATIEYKEDYQDHGYQPLSKMLQSTIPRPSTAKLEIMQDDNFFPLQYTQQNVFKRHTRLRSNLTINKGKKLLSKSHQATPPLLQQMGISLKAKLSTQSNLESLGLKVKPQHYLAPKKSEDISKSGLLDTQVSTRPPKPNIPPSFYSVKRHMMLRLKN